MELKSSYKVNNINAHKKCEDIVHEHIHAKH